MRWKFISIIHFSLFLTIIADHVTFFGRYACNVDFEESYCTSDTYVGMAFYYGLKDGGGLQSDGNFINSNISVTFFDPTVQGEASMDDTTDGLYTSNVMDLKLNENSSDTLLALIGVENDCQQVAALSQAYDSASLLVNCLDQVGESHMPSDVAIQMSSTQGGKYRAFAKVAKSIGWTNVAVINFEDDGNSDTTYHDELLKALSEESISLDFVRKGGFSANSQSATYTGLESVIDVILDSYLKTRIYVLVMESGTPGQFFMHIMSTMGLLETGKYFVIMMGTIESDSEQYLVFNSNRGSALLQTIDYGISNNAAKQHYRSFLYLTDIIHYPEDYSDEWVAFQKRVDEDAGESLCPPLCDTKLKGIAQNDPWSADAYSYSETPAIVDAYDMGRLLSETVSVHGADIIRNASLLVEYMTERTVNSLLGYVSKFHTNRVSQREYILWSPQVVSSQLIALTKWASIAAKLTPDGSGDYTSNWNNLTELGIMNGALPVSKPECGFNNELCAKDMSALSELEIVLIVICVIAILILIAVIIYISRWIAYERRLESSYYIVSRKELHLLDMTNFGSSRAGSTLQSAMSMKSSYEEAAPTNGATNLYFYQHGIRRAQKRRLMGNSNKKNDPNKNSWLDIESWHLAKFNNLLVTVRRINKTQLKLSREMKQEIDLLMNESHENLNQFYGLINEGELIFTIHSYGARKSLNDLLRNGDLRLDKMFKVSFVEDITKGLQFLHENSKIGYHGNLKSTNSIVDAYWRIKLSNFGMELIRQDEPDVKSDDLLWTSPEILRRYTTKAEMSKSELAKSDIYSFAIILYEVYGRQGPFGDDLLDSDEIIEQIKFPEGNSLTRPDIHLITKSPHPVTQIVLDCWNENPTERPNVKKIREMIKPLSNGMKGNIADNIMALLDRYRNNLEDVIKERTDQLEDEKRRNENLLLQLLPKSVANCLKNGQPVDAEFFECVSMYFSDIVGFTSLSSKSTPLQIVHMLNSLYTTFDQILDRFDCYKVETIGDAYMFVSGLPDINGYLHGGEVASASCELLESIKGFEVSHCPDEKIKLRIGNHSGPVVTGVVGIRMPRYCLFGDSVIIASNMESSGEPMKIQISCETYDLLMECGGYEVQPREKMILKNKMELMTYWLNGYSKEARISRLIKHRSIFPQIEGLIEKAKHAKN